MSTAEGWAHLGGVELFSNIRTLQYVRRQLEPNVRAISVALDPNFTPPRNTEDETQLSCYCAQLGADPCGGTGSLAPIQ